MDKKNASAFEDIRVNAKLKLFALWSSVMFFYVYGDYFQLYQPGQLQDMIAGKTHKEKATNISVGSLYLCRQRPTLPHTWRVQYHRPCGA
jgi:hypothetical protein